MVRQNDVDLLFFLDKKTDFADWVKLLEQQEPILFVASHDHMICRKKKVSLAEVVREPFVLTEKSVSYRYDLEQLLAEKSWKYTLFWKPVTRTSSSEYCFMATACLSFRNMWFALISYPGKCKP